MRLRGVVEGLEGNGGKGDAPPGPDLAVERRVVARFAELPPDERGQVGAAALVVVVRRGATIMRGRGAGGSSSRSHKSALASRIPAVPSATA